jgi:hypothetical protein
VSQVALLVAVAFWTWLWGPLGLLMATPLTVCLVVVGKHVPGLEFVGTLMADTPALPPDSSYYQRLLAGDQSEAAAIVEDFVRDQSAERVYDGLLLPALTYAERDAAEGRLSAEEERAVSDATRDLLIELAPLVAIAPDTLGPVAGGPSHRVLGYPANGQSDALALDMLQSLCAGTRVEIETTPARMLASEVVAAVQGRQFDAVCIADLPPSAPSRTRYLVKRLRRALPTIQILVGRWAPPSLADEESSGLTAAGANHVAASLVETRDRLVQLAHGLPAAPPVAAATGEVMPSA